MPITKSRVHPSYLLEPGPGRYLASPNQANWGLLSLILFLTRLSERWASKSRPPFGLGDLCKEDLSPPGGHHHVGGGAVDIYILQLGDARRSLGVNEITYSNKGAYDQELTKDLAKEISATIGEGFPLMYEGWIFNDPEVQKVAPRIIRDDQRSNPKAGEHEHDDHMHIQLHGEHPYTAAAVRRLVEGPPPPAYRCTVRY